MMLARIEDSKAGSQPRDYSSMTVRELHKDLAWPCRQIVKLKPLFEAVKKARLFEGDEPNVKQRAVQRLRLLPPAEELSRTEEKFHDAIYRKAGADQAVTLLGMMFDAFRSREDNASLPVFAQTLGYMLEEYFGDEDEFGNEGGWERAQGFDGFSPEAIAAACRMSLRASNFLPSVHEFLGYSKTARFEFWFARNLVVKMQGLRENAEFVVGYEDQSGEDVL